MKPAIFFFSLSLVLVASAVQAPSASRFASAIQAPSASRFASAIQAPSASRFAQTPDGDPQLARIRAKMADNLRRLPNYTCLMTVARSARPAGRVRDLVHQDTIRLEVAEVGDKELFAWPGAALVDQRIEDFVPDGVFASGDFSGLANIVFRTHDPTFRPSGKRKVNGREAIGYSYEVARAVSQYRLGREGHTVIVPYHGVFWVDAQSLEILRMELELDGIPDSLAVRSSVTTIDYQKSRIGESEFLLPSRVQRDIHYSALGSMSENISTFTNCRQYEAQSAIRFDEPAVTDSAPAAAAPVNPTEIRLPAGVRLAMKVETVTDAKKAAIGDLLVARLTEDVRLGELVFPAGSEVRGRIRALRWYDRGPGKLELSFTEIRTPKILATFQGFVESVEKRKGWSLGSIFKADEIQVDSNRFNMAGLVLTYRTLAVDGGVK
jgi:hypothetical protein